MAGEGVAPPSLLSPGVLEILLARAARTPPGAFLEAGVYQGGSAWHLARLAAEQQRLCVLCDTFEGIPYAGPNDSPKVGDFADTSLERVRKAIQYPVLLVPGIFPQSMHGWSAVTGLAFVHLDVDQEASYRQALPWCWDRLVPGGVIWCDDADCLHGATVAVTEFARAGGIGIIRALDGGNPSKLTLEKPL